ncbi:hypothetical protein GIB67_038402 [Kingdonia uniflora]|uniref:PRONE domain-containing protein n=1 Tax=Kingdonia uniflora TaxID=39325 RepID=A0A7J7NNZ1_9MAGN|nr:hypothetical protein GIB67_038402 [Kingdonia uniflora]
MRRLACCSRDKEISMDFDEQERIMTYNGLESCILNSCNYDDGSSTSRADGCLTDSLDENDSICSSSKDASGSFSSQYLVNKQDEHGPDEWEEVSSIPKQKFIKEVPKNTVQLIDVETMKEKFAKLLLGEDTTGGCKGLATALALSNAIANLAASVFGELWKLEPLPEEMKKKWQTEMDWLISPTNYMVELVPAKQNGANGRTLEIMTPKARSDIHLNLPALRKLDSMLIETLDSMVSTEFWYAEGGSRAEGRSKSTQPGMKWWFPSPRTPTDGLSVSGRKKLLYQAKVVHQIFKAAKSSNYNVLLEMPIPTIIQDTLPKTGKASLGEVLYKILSSESKSVEKMIDSLDLESEHNALQTMNQLEMAIFAWKQRLSDEVNSKSPVRNSWSFGKDSTSELNKLEFLLERAEDLLHMLKIKFPNLPQTFLDVTKVKYNKDIGHSIIEAYSRAIGSLAFRILSRIKDILEEDAWSNPNSPVPTCGQHSESNRSKASEVRTCNSRNTSISSSLLDSTLSSSSPSSLEQSNGHKFTYSRSSPSIRWPHLKFKDTPTPPPPPTTKGQSNIGDTDVMEKTPTLNLTLEALEKNDETLEVLGRPSRTRVKKMTKLALKRAKDWRQRVQILSDKILKLESDEFVADVLDDRPVQMTPTDFCYVVKNVGKLSWHRALEIYEWLNLRHWYSPNARMLVTILSVLGKANQESLAVELFMRAEAGIEDAVQVYNAMMGVYSRNGRFTKVQELLDLMRTRGCEPDLVSFNTLINARSKSGSMVPGLAMELLNEVRRSGLRPDIITYNTLLSACSRGSDFEEAVKIYDDLEASHCQPDLWTYNAMISVYGRCGMAKEAECLFKKLGSKGFFPDAVTYNSLLFAFAREGNVLKVKEICDEMVEAGFGKDEMTYNTIIHMYGKQGQHDLALQTYKDMKSSRRNPDAVTYTVLIDSLGKADKIVEAADVMSEMLDTGVKPTLRSCSALICGYAKAGMRVEAEKTFDRMIRSGIKPDHLAYSVMLDILLRSNETKKGMRLYKEMIREGFKPDQGLYEVMLQVLAKDNRVNDVDKVVKDMDEVCGMSPQVISNILVKGDCHEHAGKMLKLAVTEGYEPDSENLLSILNSYSLSGKQTEAQSLVNVLREHAPKSHNLITEASILMFCKDRRLNSAMEEYHETKGFGMFSCSVYESLIQCCEESESFAVASQLYADMKFYGLELTQNLYQSLMRIYCKLGFPETAHCLMDQAESFGYFFNDFSVFVDIIEVYGKLKLWQKAESVVGKIRVSYSTINRNVWNALLHAYAVSGRYEQARAVFNTMMRDGPSPTVDSVNCLLQALIVDERLDELYVVIQELQDMGFKISKSSILLMLDAFARSGNIFEVKKIYHGMKASGYLPTMHLYRSMIGLLARGKRVRDVEAMVTEMEEAVFKPDLAVYNSLLKMYTGIGDFRRTSEVYQRLQKEGYKPDGDTYNTLILMYCRDLRPEEGLSLLEEMTKQGLDPKLDTYKSLISACGKQSLCEEAENLFKGMQSKGCKVDRSIYHMMMKMYRNSGDLLKAENLLVMMKEAGVEPTIATMHLLMVSYGSAGQPKEAENVLDNLKTMGLELSTLPYSSVIDAYLKDGNHSKGIEKLWEMKRDGLESDHRIWTCFIRSASLSKTTSLAMVLLNVLRETGFDLPIRVAEKDWGADFRKMSPGAALVGLTLWLDHMQARLFSLLITAKCLQLYYCGDASLQGSPESPKSVVLITGTAEYNMVSLNNTLKAYLWEIGSPFLPCKTCSGLLIAKAHSLRMWLKDSPFCLDLELKDAPSLPVSNSMQLSEGYFIRSGLAPVFKDVHERLGQVRPKKFARLALLTEEKREKVILADIKGRKEKLEKMKERGTLERPRKKQYGKKKFIRSTTLAKPDNGRFR